MARVAPVLVAAAAAPHVDGVCGGDGYGGHRRV
eukprot:ctg_2841.g585